MVIEMEKQKVLNRIEISHQPTRTDPTKKVQVAKATQPDESKAKGSEAKRQRKQSERKGNGKAGKSEGKENSRQRGAKQATPRKPGGEQKQARAREPQKAPERTKPKADAATQ